MTKIHNNLVVPNKNPILVNPLVKPTLTVEEKYEKHLKESEPILSGTLTPFEAFQGGFEKAIASYLKLGNEGKVKKVVSETPNKNIETMLMEELIHNLLKDFDSVKFIKKNKSYLAICQGKVYQFSALLEKVNFNLISLNLNHLKSYQKLLDTGKLYHQPQLHTGGKPTAKDFEKADPKKSM